MSRLVQSASFGLQCVFAPDHLKSEPDSTNTERNGTQTKTCKLRKSLTSGNQWKYVERVYLLFNLFDTFQKTT